MRKLKKKVKKEKQSRFEKRDKGVLQSIYENREKRSKLSSGKSPFNKDILEELEIEEFKGNLGDNFIEILPLSFKKNKPYCYECSIHNNVGLNLDNFVCTQRRDVPKPCYRCGKQKKLYRIEQTTTKYIKSLYPSDRAIYLIWDRTAEFKEDKNPEYKISVFNASKKAIHLEIQNLVKDKKKQTILDIVAFGTTGGRTVYFKKAITESKDGKFPKFTSFELLERDDEIPEEIQEKLTEILEYAEEQGKHIIEVLLHFPTYEEVEESMKSEEGLEHEESDEDEDENEEPKGRMKPSGKSASKLEASRKAVSKRKQRQKDIPDLEELEEELSELSEKKILAWCERKGIEDQIDEDMDKDEMVEAIVTYYEELSEELD